MEKRHKNPSLMQGRCFCPYANYWVIIGILAPWEIIDIIFLMIVPHGKREIFLPVLLFMGVIVILVTLRWTRIFLTFSKEGILWGNRLSHESRFISWDKLHFVYPCYIRGNVNVILSSNELCFFEIESKRKKSSHYRRRLSDDDICTLMTHSQYDWFMSFLSQNPASSHIVIETKHNC